MSDEIKAAREWLDIFQRHSAGVLSGAEVRTTLLAALDALEREPELRARIAELEAQVQRQSRDIRRLCGELGDPLATPLSLLPSLDSPFISKLDPPDQTDPHAICRARGVPCCTACPGGMKVGP